MNYQGIIVAQASKKLEHQQKLRQQQKEETRDYAYQLDPRIAEIDQQLRGTMSKILGCSLRPDPAVSLEDLKDENLRLQQERLERLAALRVDSGLVDGVYQCSTCSDSGWVGKTMCDCLHRYCIEEQLTHLAPLLQQNLLGFQNFNLQYYSQTPLAGLGTSAYELMSMVLASCHQYVAEFPHAKEKNLLFIGSTGLGKTFLSGCIARDLTVKGASVMYGNAIQIREAFETRRFRKHISEEYIPAEKLCQAYLQCDLLIFDDLGTEPTNSVTDTFLYELLNTRLLNGLHTIISTNFVKDELKNMYSPQIMSRLLGEFTSFTFCGEDIRQQKKKEY